jgi:hypothetical protein
LGELKIPSREEDRDGTFDADVREGARNAQGPDDDRVRPDLILAAVAIVVFVTYQVMGQDIGSMVNKIDTSLTAS